MLRKEDFNYNFPSELIAQAPIYPRDQARLLLVDKKKKKISHDKFLNLIDILNPNDLLVINDSKVFPARLRAKKTSGGRLEVFLLKKETENIWQCLIRGKIKPGLTIVLSKKLRAQLIDKKTIDTWLIKFNLSGQALIRELKKIGQVPLPPYIKKGLADKSDYQNYQTIYANKNQEKSVAAPTAGFHFTEKMMNKIRDKKIELLKISLHVGLGTFAPVKVDNIKNHKMHSETMIIKKAALTKILQVKKDKGKIVAVGTTVCRALETMGQNLSSIDKNQDYQADTDIFIYPAYKFLMTDILLTNFHLPCSTLLMLVSALAGTNLIRQAYQEAIKEKYRLFSYGDAMLIY